MATSPSSPTGWASSQSCGRPSSRSGATRMVRLPSRMFLLNSWPTSVSCSLISLMRARVSSSRSTPARRKSVRVLSSRRAAWGSSSAASRAAITSYSSRSSWNSVPILCTSWTAASPRRADGLVGVDLAEQRTHGGGVAHADHAVVPDLQRLLGRGRLARLEAAYGVTRGLEPVGAAPVEPVGEVVGGGKGDGSQIGSARRDPCRWRRQNQCVIGCRLGCRGIPLGSRTCLNRWLPKS